MYFLYSILFTLGFVVLLPRFVFDVVFNGKYAAGFSERLGSVPKINSKGKKVVWIHCVSVGEANAARPLAQAIKDHFPAVCLVISTTTRTGQELARTAFADIAEQVFYFPFDWRWTVRRTLKRIGPASVLLMETEIWFNFLRETHKSGTRLAIVNGRLSERSYTRFTYIKKFMRRVLGYLDLAVMQENIDATRIMALGLRASKVRVSGNMKFDHGLADQETALTDELRRRFKITSGSPLLIAASTHSPEEKWVLDAFKEIKRSSGQSQPRLMIAPRHPERFAEVADLIRTSGFASARRSDAASTADAAAEVILLDSIGELRSAYTLAEIVFVGGSLIKHGGQSIFEPAAAGKAIVTGPYTANFDAAVKEFLDKEALIQLPAVDDGDTASVLADALNDLLVDRDKRNKLGTHALATMNNNRGAVARTLEYISPLLGPPDTR
jgi:3-deoxy-D-manno-octulosonic-acid transferase